MKKFDFSDSMDKVCVITGGAGVIGRAVCEALAANGIKTAIVDLDISAANELAASLTEKHGTRCTGVQANVLDKESLLQARKYILEKLGSIDYLINGAGGNSPDATTKIEQITDEGEAGVKDSFFGLDLSGFDKVFALNFTGTLLPTMVFARDMVMRGSGVVINISSMNSFRPLTKIPAYSAAKASVNNFTQWLAVHLAKTGVRVNAVAPGFFLTNQNRFLLVNEQTGKATPRGEKIIANTPVGHYGKPEDIQGAVLFLLSELSSFITGVVLPVDGGYSAYGGV
ncbi:MAG TPA: SDR family oxidoreductase [Bacteroidales bacterium]|nr:SDR family oxidoreductase [Bacteroidales bacterium]